MKTDRRHELQGNDLATALVRVRDTLGQHSRQITIGLVAVVAIVVVATFAVRSRAAAYEGQWRRFAQLQFTDAAKAKDSISALQGLCAQASDDRFRMATLIKLAHESRQQAQKADHPPDLQMLDVAKGAYEQMLREFPQNPLAVGTAHCGLSTIAESKFVLTRDPNLKKEANEHLAAVIDSPLLAGLPFQRIAIERRNALDTAFEVMAFAASSPSPAPPAQPTALTPSVEGLVQEPAVEPVIPKATIFVNTPEGQKAIDAKIEFKTSEIVVQPNPEAVCDPKKPEPDTAPEKKEEEKKP